MIDYLEIPKEIGFDELWSKGSLSPSLYEKVICNNPNVKRVKDLLKKVPPEKGIEVGSSSYVNRSDHYFIRTRALQEFGFLIQADLTSVIPIKPQEFKAYNLSKADILYSKDSNIGECCIIESNVYDNHMISSGILKLKSAINPYYLFGFLKHPFVKAQLKAMTAKGSTIRHSGLGVLECKIPFPSGSNAKRIIDFISLIVQNIVEIESLIREKDRIIYNIISEELTKGQKQDTSFHYEYPSVADVLSTGRLDAGIYSEEYKKSIFLITNYKNGYRFLTDETLNFHVKPGPSLELKILGTRRDFKEFIDGCYTLILPTNISEYGTMEKIQYIGTPTEIEELRFGDILIGESGTWRSIVLLTNYPKCITNAHGQIIRHRKNNLTLSIFVRCMLSWYYKTGVFDFMAVGGSGGHLSASYFDRIAIPNFPENIQKKISKLYYQTAQNENDLGIAQLNEKKFMLLNELNHLLDDIVGNIPISLPKNSALPLND